MSSRAAGGRRRLQEPKPPRPPSESSKALRSFFSRSKSAAPKTQDVPRAPPTPSIPMSPHRPSNTGAGGEFVDRNGIKVWRSEAPQEVHHLAQNQRSSPHPSSFVHYPSPEPQSRIQSPYPPTELQDSYGLKKSTSMSNLAPSDPYDIQFPTPPSHGILEATYQPPPPSRFRSQTLTPASNSPLSTRSPQFPVQTPPSSFRPVTQAPRDGLNSLLLQPEPEPPRYTPNPSESPMHLPSHLTPLRREPVNTRYEQPAMYPSPPSSDHNLPQRSEHTPLIQPHPLSNRNRNYPPPSPSPYHEHYTAVLNQSAAAAPTPSSSNSSIHSGKSSKSNKSAKVKPGAPGFVFPGSRSTARPKVAPKKITTQPSTESMSPPPSPAMRRSPAGRTGLLSPANSLGPLPPPPVPRQRAASSSASAMSATSGGTGGDSSGQASLKHPPEKPTFVYPGGRSRAQPSSAPISLPNLKLKKSSKNSIHSSNSSVKSGGKGRKRFMGIPLKKKKTGPARADTPESPLAFTLNLNADGTSIADGSTSYYDGASQIGSTTSNGGPAGPEFEAYRDHQMSPEVRRTERMARIKSRIGSYPLDPYDSILLDNDRHTGDLLNRLNGTGSPTFHDYGNHPPSTVLDLGCGQGHWVVNAAIAWKGHGTRVTGYDLVDISKVLLPWATKQGVAENIHFVRGNFLKQRLPFPDNSFDLVRMSSLTLCITVDAWIFVFQEVCRVLTVGGRLELIDDAIIYPYGKPTSSGTMPASPSTPRINVIPPRLDIQIPSAAFTTFSIYDDSDRRNPGLGNMYDEEEEDEEFYDLYQVKEECESDADETATLSGVEPEANKAVVRRDHHDRERERSSAATPIPLGSRNSSKATQNNSRLKEWNAHAATSRDLEALFEHMLTHKFGIHINPDEFIMNLMQEVFGHTREVRTMHLSLAPPEIVPDDDSLRGRQGDSKGQYGNSKHYPSPSPARTVSSRRAVGTPLSRSPGLILSPSTFIPMTQSELEIHASKHLRMLLSCKKFLVEHALEATEDEEIDEDSVLEALWEYESFLRARFNHPPVNQRDRSPSSFDRASARESILSVSSEAQDAMWEYQSELRQRFAWPADQVDVSNPTGAPTSTLTQQAPPQRSSNPAVGNPAAARPSSPQPSINVAPPYSRGEMTHVRTFRVYEAIKLDESFFNSNSYS